MSQRSRRSRNSQQTLEESFTQSQSSQSQSNAVNIEELVQRCVRFFVLNMNCSVPIPRAKLFQQVFKEKPGRQFDLILKTAAKHLDKIYGLKLQVLQTDSSIKKYILTSALEYPELITKSREDKFKNTITSLVLAHIFMSKGSCTEKSIWDFLAELNIKPENSIYGVGQVEQLITKTLVKEQILSVDNTKNDDSSKTRYCWGPVAETSVSKKDLLKFYSQMYDDISMKGFEQYEEAKNQQDGSEKICL